MFIGDFIQIHKLIFVLWQDGNIREVPLLESGRIFNRRIHSTDFKPRVLQVKHCCQVTKFDSAVIETNH